MSPASAWCVPHCQVGCFPASGAPRCHGAQSALAAPQPPRSIAAPQPPRSNLPTPLAAAAAPRPTRCAPPQHLLPPSLSAIQPKNLPLPSAPPPVSQVRSRASSTATSSGSVGHKAAQRLLRGCGTSAAAEGGGPAGAATACETCRKPRWACWVAAPSCWLRRCPPTRASDGGCVGGSPPPAPGLPYTALSVCQAAGGATGSVGCWSY